MERRFVVGDNVLYVVGGCGTPAKVVGFAGEMPCGSRGPLYWVREDAGESFVAAEDWLERDRDADFREECAEYDEYLEEVEAERLALEERGIDEALEEQDEAAERSADCLARLARVA